MKKSTKSTYYGNKIINKGSSPWAQLSDDLVGEITSRLWLLSDQVRFRAVCKNWLHAVDEYKYNIVQLPWVIHIETSINNNIIECYLYESSSKPTLVYKINWHEYEIFPKNNPSCWDWTSTSSKKNGWIFSSRRLDIGGCYFTTFLLFSPLTKKVIILPRLANSPREYRHVHLITFSTKPDSPDCVFLVMSKVKNTITINIFGHGYKEWKSQEIGIEGIPIFWYIRREPVYIERTFYFLFYNGVMASYNIALGEWKVVSELVDNSFPEMIQKYKAFELNGELMFICIGKDSGFIKMLDRSANVWVPLQSLGDQSIFISHNSVLVLRIGKSKYGVQPNKIYFSRHLQHSVYSLESGKLAKISCESEFPKWAKTNLHGNWFEPPGDVLKRIKPWNSLKKLVSVQKILPAVTEPGIVGKKSSMVEELVLRDPQINQIKESLTEDNMLENLMVLDQMRRSRIDPRDNGSSSIKPYNKVKRGKQRKNM